MLRTSLFLTRTQVVVSLLLTLVLGVVLWVTNWHVSATTVALTTPTAIPARQSLTQTTTVQSALAPTAIHLTDTPTQTCTETSFAESPEVVIGALAPLSKPGAMQSGFAMQTAFNLAVEELNQQSGAGGKPVRLVAYDTAGLPAQGAKAAEQLIMQDCAVALVGVYHSQVALAVKEVVQRLNRPIIFVDPYADEITADHSPQVFRIAPTSSMLAQLPGQWLAEVGDYNHDGVKAVAVVVENSTHGLARATNAQKWLPQAGFAVEAIAVDVPANDPNTVIARVVALEHMPDALFLYLHGDVLYDLAQALIAAGIGPQKKTLLVLNSHVTNAQSFWAHTPDGVYTVIPHIGPWPTTANAHGQRFAERYRTYFDRWPEAYAFAAYDAVLLVADAISRTHSLVADDLIAALEQSDIELAAGRYTFPYHSQNPPDGVTVPAYLWHQWPNPPLYYLQYTAPQQAASDAVILWPPSARTSAGPVVRPTESAP